MAHGKRSTDGCASEEPPLSLPAFEEVLSYVDPNSVITWLKPFGELRANAFWRKYSFPPQVRVAFPSLGSQFAACTDMIRGQMNCIYWPEIHISEGLRVLSPLADSLISLLHSDPPRLCSCEHHSGSPRGVHIEQVARP